MNLSSQLDSMRAYYATTVIDGVKKTERYNPHGITDDMVQFCKMYESLGELDDRTRNIIFVVNEFEHAYRTLHQDLKPCLYGYYFNPFTGKPSQAEVSKLCRLFDTLSLVGDTSTLLFDLTVNEYEKLLKYYETVKNSHIKKILKTVDNP